MNIQEMRAKLQLIKVKDVYPNSDQLYRENTLYKWVYMISLNKGDGDIVAYATAQDTYSLESVFFNADTGEQEFPDPEIAHALGTLEGVRSLARKKRTTKEEFKTFSALANIPVPILRDMSDPQRLTGVRLMMQDLERLAKEDRRTSAVWAIEVLRSIALTN